MAFPPSSAPTFPLVGRVVEQEMLGAALDDAVAGRGGTIFLTGEGGVGKTRLARFAAEEMERRRGTVCMGRSYPVETGIPYALFSDALLPLLRSLDPAALVTLTRGAESELAWFIPALSRPGDRTLPPSDGDPAELKTRLLWNFTQLLGRLAARQPLLLVLDDVQWADPSSLELLHFTARQIASERILLLCTYNRAERDQNPSLRTTEQSLLAMGAARTHPVDALSADDTAELIQRGFGVDAAVTQDLTALLHDWTRGNPFFVEEALKALVESGRLRQQEGTWIGWEIQELELPRSVRDAVLTRVDRLAPEARSVAEIAAAVGTRTTYEALRAVSPLPEADLLTALDALRRSGILVERAAEQTVVYDFAHPVLRDTLYRELGLARARLLHAAIAEALETFYGDSALERADELALHFVRSGARHLAAKSVRYLGAAGERALARQANREAVSYLAAALQEVEAVAPDSPEAEPLVESLARAHQRLGEYDAAIPLWDHVLASAVRDVDPARAASVHRMLGLAQYWSGRHEEALAQYDRGIAAAAHADSDALLARLRLAKGMCLQELGRASDAQAEVGAALQIAAERDEPALLARVHRALLLLYAWTGPAELARDHGDRAVALAEQSGDRSVACSTHWALAMLSGFVGDSRTAAHHIAASERLAEDLRSPVRRLWTSELAIEYASGTGDWDGAVALAERSIALARRLGQRTLLPRLLVWAGLIYLAQGKTDQGHAYVQEAWDLSGAEGAGPMDVHTAVPAHTGVAACHLAEGDFARAIEVGEAGLAIADRSGYVVWATHRLIPVIAEAALWSRDLSRAVRLGKRLRRDSAKLGNRLGLAWADTCDALVLRLHGETPRAIELLRGAVEQLEAIPFPVDAARLRRWLAVALADEGLREAAVQELRRAHETFAQVGAVPELENVREKLRELGARPPARQAAGGGELSEREAEIAQLVAARRSNKAVAQALRISPRTVSTHLSHIFRKLGVSSRAELADRIRESGAGSA